MESQHLSSYPEITDPKHVLINISESGCGALLPQSLPQLIEHARKHMRRIFPRGTRIRSSNLDPLRFWRNGSQVASLNWQNYDKGMQVNEGMFVGSPGWVLKPGPLMGAGNAMTGRWKLEGEVVGISSCEYPSGLGERLNVTSSFDPFSATPEWTCR